LRFRLCAAALLAAWSGTLIVAQQKVVTPEELDTEMKKVQPAMQAAQKALKSQSFEDARAQLAIVRKVMEDTQGFWVSHKKEDAIKANQDTIAGLEKADKALGATPVDMPTVLGAMKEANGGCRVCHDAYRDRDAEKNYILKPGSIGQ